MRDDPVEYRALATARTKEPRFVVNIEFPTGSLYVTSHPDIAGVPGTVLEACLADPTVTSQRLNPDEGRAEIGSASFRIVDRASQFTTQIRNQLANGNGLRRRKVRFYKGFKGQAYSQFQLYATQIVSGADYEKGAYSVQCSDVQRSARKDVFAPVTTTLASSISATDTTIGVASTAGFARVYHGPSYSDAPNQTVGYLRIKDEWIRYTGTTGTSFTGCTRGVFGTIAAAYTVDASTPTNRREKVSEGMYVEIPGPKALYAILTGDLYGDGAQLPAHWHLGIDPSLVRVADFTGIGLDIWDPSDDTKGFVPRFLGVGKTDGKKFYEEQLLRVMGMFAPVYADGSLGLRKMTPVLADAATVVTLDESNCVQTGALEHDMDSLRNVFTAQWNPSADGKSFTREITLLDAFSVATHGRGEEIKLSFLGLWGGRHTDSTLYRLIDGLRDRYAAPPERISVDVFSSLDAIEVGDVVRLKLKHVRDFAGNTVGIDRAFEVQGTSVNHRTGRVSLQLFGSTAPASALAPTQNVTSLPDAFYNSAGTDLSTIVTIAAGVMAAGSYTLTGSADLTAAPSIFYYLGDLTQPQTVTLNIVGNVQLRVRGYFTQNGAILGVGQGKPGVADAAGPTQPVGNPGYVGNARGWDGINISRDYGDGPPDMETLPAQLTRGANPTFPTLLLEVVGNTLRGLPTDLRGTGGAPGGRILTSGSTIRSLGGSGANGGAGLCVISRGYGLGASATTNLSGNSSTPTAVLTPDRNTYAAGPGGAGGPGALLVLLDGSLLSVPDFTGRFIANTGSVVLPSGTLPPTGLIQFLDNEGRHRYPSNTGVWMGYQSPDVISARSLSVAALRVQFVPAPETPAQDADTKPPPLTGLTATPQVGGIAIEVTVPDWSLFDLVEIYASVDDQRSNAAKIAEFRGTRFVHPLPGGAQRWYWGRTVRGLTIFGTPNASDWYQNSETSTIQATAAAAGSGPAGESVYIQYSADASSWHDPPAVGGDIYLRTRLGTSGSWSPAARFVGEQGIPGSPGSTGNFVDVIFIRAASQPATPTGTSPAGWSDGPPAANGDALWVSYGEKTAAGALVGTWSVPVQIESVARTVTLRASDQRFTFNAANVPEPSSQTITLNASRQNIPSGGLTWTLETSSGAGASWSTNPGTSDTGAVNLASLGANQWLRVTVFRTGEPAVSDSITIYRLRGGNAGTNLVDPTEWKVGTSGTQGTFQAIGGATETIVLGGASGEPLGPTGASEPLWKAVNTDNYTGGEDPDGGFNRYGIPVDAKKPYRASIWCRTSAVLGSRYLGCSGDATATLAGVPDTNPYPVAAGVSTLGMLANRWYLFVGIIHGSDYAGGNSGLTGVYDTEGRKIYAGDDKKNLATAVAQAMRVYSYYGDPSTTWWARPRFDELNGSEPSLQDLLQGSPATLGTSLAGYLTNESHTVPADAGGNVTSWAAAGGQFKVFYGTTDVTSSCTFSVASNPQGLTLGGSGGIIGSSTGAYSIDGGLDAAEANASVTFRATYLAPGGATLTIDKVFTLTKSVAGQGSYSLVLQGWTQSGTTLRGDTGGWGTGQAYSTQGYPAAFCSAKLSSVAQYVMFGLNSDPTADASYTSLDHAWYCSNGVLYTYHNNYSQSIGSCANGDVLSIVYDGVYVRFFQNGVLRLTVADPGRTMYFDTSASGPAQLDQVAFGPSALATSPGLTLVPRNSGSALMAAVANACQKTGGPSSWEGDCYSAESYVGPCEVSFRVHCRIPGGAYSASAAYLMGGLTTDPTASAEYNTIDHAIFVFPGDSTVRIYENGNEKLNTGYSFGADDIFNVRYTGTQIEYRMNGTLLKSTPAPPNLRLHFDSAFAQNGSQILDIKFQPLNGTGQPNFKLIAGSNNAVAGNTISKTGGSAGWNSGAYSEEAWVNGAYCSFRVDQLPSGSGSAIMMAGLNADPTTDQSYEGIDYCWYVDGGVARSRYPGNANEVSHGGFSNTTVLAIAYDGKAIYWLKDGVVVRMVAAPANLKLHFDCSLYSVGTRITDIGFGPSGASGSDGSPGVSPVSIVLVPETAQIPCDYLGAVKDGVLPKSIGVAVAQAGSSILPTSVALTPSGCTVGAYSGGYFTITGVSTANPYVDVDVTAAGQTVRKRLTLTKQLDPQSKTSALTQFGTGPITSASTFATTALLSINASSTGKLRLSASCFWNCSTTGDGIWAMQAKLQWRAAGGSWADVSGTTVTGQATNFGGAEPGEWAIGPVDLTGLTASALYEIQLLTRKSGGSANLTGGSGGLAADQIP